MCLYLSFSMYMNLCFMYKNMWTPEHYTVKELQQSIGNEN